DGGATWETRPLDGGEARNLSVVRCVSGADCLVARAGGGIVRTADGGATGELVPTGVAAPVPAWAGSGRVVVVGAAGETAVSTDAGRSFAPGGGRLPDRYSALRRSGGRVAALVGLGGAFARTTDAGASWAPGAVSTTEDLADLRF